MSRELDTWRTEHRNNKRQLRMLADTNTDANTQALKVCVCTYTARTHADDAQARLADLDARIKDAEDACAAVRTKIYANDTHIRQLIANVTNR
jgi:septal ring factor EnvC (AmiA/AmiB activator)